MPYHPVVQQIISLLDRNHYWYQTFEHQPVITSQQAAALRVGYSIKQGIKAMIIRVKITNNDKKFVMLCLPADRKFDEQLVKNYFSAKDIRLATEEEISKLTDNVQRGGVPPFGNLFHLLVLADPAIFTNEKVIFNAGDRRYSIAMKSADYHHLVQPRLIQLTTELL